MGKRKATTSKYVKKTEDQSVTIQSYIDAKINEAAGALLTRQQQASQNALIRQVALEEIVMEKLNVSRDELATRVAQVQDRVEGFMEAGDAVVSGDRVRIEIKTKTKDQTDFQGSTRLLVSNVGSGATLGNEIENGILGMVPGEVRDITFGKEGALLAQVSLNRVSRKPKLQSETSPQVSPAQKAAPSAETSAS